MSGDPARAEIDAAVLAWLREPHEAWRRDDDRFERLALDLFAFQFEHCEPYRRFCEGRERTPDDVRTWRDVPAVPTGAFKEVELRSFPAERESHCFRTSGTSVARRGTLSLDTLELYEASLLPAFRRHVLPDLEKGERAAIHVLAPPAREVPDSSLSHMFAIVLRELGTDDGGFAMRDGELETRRLVLELSRAVAATEPVTLCGTAFAFVHLCDALEAGGAALGLPDGSRVMETGGFKGRSRELAPDALYDLIRDRLGIPARRIVNQYGMTELGSQFYDSVLRHPGEARRKLAPPWTRVLIADPTSGREVEPGEVGSIRIFDLANTGSVFAVQTADLGRAAGDGFEVLGREPGAEARGCSIAADELLAGAAT